MSGRIPHLEMTPVCGQRKKQVRTLFQIRGGSSPDRGLTGGGPLSADVTLAAKLTDSVSLADSTTAASATAVKSAYDRGTAGVTAAGEGQKLTDEKRP